MSRNSNKLVPVILSGGSGTRLWPVSRRLYPKQFHSFSDNGSLLQQTTERALQLCGERNTDVVVVCNEAHRFIVKEQLAEIGVTAPRLLLEPVPRNTAPAVAVAAFYLAADDPGTIMLVLPSDHIITDLDEFSRCVDTAVDLAARDYLVTFGITATRPETGYGYIHRGAELTDQSGSRAYSVTAFVEKPDVETAVRYLDSGEYFWNSGMFALKAGTYLRELEALTPAIYRHARDAVDKRDENGVFALINSEDFAACPADSIDYAIMENTQHAAVVPFSGGWSDVGSWGGVAGAIAPDEQENVISGDVVTVDVKNSVIISKDRLISAVGIKDTVVVETDDAVLVVNKAADQQVKQLVDDLRASKRQEAETHTKVYRPWGSYQCLDCGERFQVKRLVIKPGASISLQLHNHRSEHWVVVTGTATVTRDTEVFEMHTNESTYIPAGTMHKLENKSDTDLEIVEVQTGEYLGEDDIVRFSDQYGRVNEN